MADRPAPRPRPTDPDEREIAEIGGLLDEPAPKPTAPRRPAVAPREDLDGYEVGDIDLPTPKPKPKAPKPIPPDPPRNSPEAPRPRPSSPKPSTQRTPRRPSRDEDQDEELDALTEESTVDPVWSRKGEWGGTLTLMGIVGGVVLVVAYWLMTSGQLGLGLLSLVVGLGVVVLLSYPIAVTLEVPVRMTPERALKDYYAALSHHFPHYGRMWLLLSDLGRDSPEFANRSEFREYWRERLGKLRRKGGVKKATPLEFEVVGFDAAKSTGKDANAGRVTVRVSPRGGEPIESSTYEVGFARGPDRMWYLNQGDLPAS